MQLPILSRLALPVQYQDLTERLKSLMWRDAMIDPSSGGLMGYLRAQRPDGFQAFLFIENGIPYRAGSIEAWAFQPRQLDEFKSQLEGVQQLEFNVTTRPCSPRRWRCLQSLRVFFSSNSN